MKNKSVLYVCVLVLMGLELITNSYLLDKNGFLLALLNCIVIGMAYIGTITIADIFYAQEKYAYINLLGMSLLTLLFSCLLFEKGEFSIDENMRFTSMIQLAIYQIGSLIKIYIPISIVLCDNIHEYKEENVFHKYRKPIGYIGISLIAVLLLNDYRMLFSIVAIGLVSVILKK